MTRVVRTCLLITAIVLLLSASLFAQGFRAAPPAPIVTSYSFAPPFFGGFGSSFLGYPSYGNGYSAYPAPIPYAPNYWWVSPYPIADPRQEGYNQYAGYEWDSVGTLILSTSPAKARVTLDGVFIGMASYLGPTQLPVGEHTLRIEAAGYEPYEGVIKIEQPGFKLLDVDLKHALTAAKPAPQS